MARVPIPCSLSCDNTSHVVHRPTPFLRQTFGWNKYCLRSSKVCLGESSSRFTSTVALTCYSSGRVDEVISNQDSAHTKVYCKEVTCQHGDQQSAHTKAY